MITYTKSINCLQVMNSEGGEANVVYQIGWSLIGVDGAVTASCPALTHKTEALTTLS